MTDDPIRTASLFPVQFRLLEPRDGNPAGTIVYPCTQPDYELTGEDRRATGERHWFVTLDPTGDYPGFTVPLADLALV